MQHDDSGGSAAGYIHSLISPGRDDYPCYARFRRVGGEGEWIRGSGVEKSFDNEQQAIEWLLSLGCPVVRITICRPGIDAQPPSTD